MARLTGLRRAAEALAGPDAAHDLRRLARRFGAPAQYARLAALRETPVADEDTVSLRPFVEREAIFVHIPKCAGLTVAKTLFGCRGGAHMSVDLYRIAFSAAEYRRFFKFTFTRNPWDRVVSAYHFLKDGGLGEKDREMAARSVDRYASFRDFVLGYLPNADLDDVQHFRPQHRYVCDSGSGRLDVDFVGRVETLERDLAHVQARLGLPPGLASRNRGRSRAADWRGYYDDASAEVVARVYARDVALFGYALDA